MRAFVALDDGDRHHHQGIPYAVGIPTQARWAEDEFGSRQLLHVEVIPLCLARRTGRGLVFAFGLGSAAAVGVGHVRISRFCEVVNDPRGHGCSVLPTAVVDHEQLRLLRRWFGDSILSVQPCACVNPEERLLHAERDRVGLGVIDSMMLRRDESKHVGVIQILHGFFARAKSIAVGPCIRSSAVVIVLCPVVDIHAERTDVLVELGQHHVSLDRTVPLEVSDR
mmetsp:Transcript_23316/g.65043  ORF Transcript_23316/g.65043 Transcript_23316/m.65043 type:complete len:224 (-) Transcript_23316:30-701(-)